jgi:DNA-binding transcriptional MerR regulator
MLTVTQIAKELNIPNSTVAYRIKLFDDYISSTGTGRSKRYEENTIEILRTIDSHITNSVPIDDIKKILDSEYAIPHNQSELQNVPQNQFLHSDKVNYNINIETSEIKQILSDSNSGLKEVIRLLQLQNELLKQQQVTTQQQRHKWWKFWK